MEKTIASRIYHKDNFAYNPQVKLTNPAKNKLGRISYTG